MATLLTADAVLPMEDAERRSLLQPGAVLVDRGLIAASARPRPARRSRLSVSISPATP
jgi:hypothetical protein